MCLHLAAVRGAVRDVLARSRDCEHLLASGRVHPDVAAAVRALGLGPGSPL